MAKKYGQQFPAHGAAASTDFVYLTNNTTGPVGTRPVGDFGDDLAALGKTDKTGIAATRVAYSNGSSLVGSANLTFDGTKLSAAELTIGLAANRIPFANGLKLTSQSDFTFNGSKLSAPAIAADNLTADRVCVFSGSQIRDYANLTFDGTLLTAAEICATTSVFAKGNASPSTGEGILLRNIGSNVNVVDSHDFGSAVWREMRLRCNDLRFYSNDAAHAGALVGTNWLLGNSTTAAGSSAVRCLVMQNGTKPTTYPHVHLYAAASELHVVDGGGNDTTLSPHATDGPAWLYDDPGLDRIHVSENAFAGQVEWSNESRAGRLSTLSASELSKLTTQQKTTYVVETFSEYNVRRGLVAGDSDYLTPRDWDAHESDLAAEAAAARDKWIDDRAAFDQAFAAWPIALAAWSTARAAAIAAHEIDLAGYRAALAEFDLAVELLQLWRRLPKSERDEIEPPEIPPHPGRPPVPPAIVPPPAEPTWNGDDAPPPLYSPRPKPDWAI